MKMSAKGLSLVESMLGMLVAGLTVLGILEGSRAVLRGTADLRQKEMASRHFERIRETLTLGASCRKTFEDYNVVTKHPEVTKVMHGDGTDLYVEGANYDGNLTLESITAGNFQVVDPAIPREGQFPLNLVFNRSEASAYGSARIEKQFLIEARTDAANKILNCRSVVGIGSGHWIPKGNGDIYFGRFGLSHVGIGTDQADAGFQVEGDVGIYGNYLNQSGSQFLIQDKEMTGLNLYLGGANPLEKICPADCFGAFIGSHAAPSTGPNNQSSNSFVAGIGGDWRVARHNKNIFIGHTTNVDQPPDTTYSDYILATDNIVIGHNSEASYEPFTENVTVGTESGRFMSGERNVQIGSFIKHYYHGIDNVFIGAGSGGSFGGYCTLPFGVIPRVHASRNVCVGTNSCPCVRGEDNIAIGHESVVGDYVSENTYNISIGIQAGLQYGSYPSKSRSIAIGSNARCHRNCLAIGFKANWHIDPPADSLSVGSNTHHRALTPKPFNIGNAILGSEGRFIVGGHLNPPPAGVRLAIGDGSTAEYNGVLKITGVGGTCTIDGNANDCGTSDIMAKQDVRPLETNWKNFTALRTVVFDWKNNGKSDLGFIAQEVEEIYPELVEYHSASDRYLLNYNGMLAPLMKAQKNIIKIKKQTDKTLNDANQMVSEIEALLEGK